MLLYGAKKELLPWASKQIFGIEDGFRDADQAIGIMNGAYLIGVVVYSDYRPNLSIEMSIATIDRRWGSRYNIGALFKFPFIDLGVKRVHTLCSANNREAIMVQKKLGLTPEGYHRHAYHDGSDAISWGMLKEDCRWIKHG